jgi:pimeloyl-ACP methyl ester carboxylesterase
MIVRHPGDCSLWGVRKNIQMWTAAVSMQHLSKQFRVIAMDSRGHGRSGKPLDQVSYGMSMVADVVRLLDRLEVKKAHFIGFSMGAETALKLGIRHPDRVLSMVLAGSGWSGKDDYELYRLVADSLGKSASFGPLLREMTPIGEAGPTDAEISAADEMLRGQDIEALVAAARGMDDIINVSRDELSGIRFPVLGIAGENDPERGNLEKMRGVVPGFTMKVLEGRGHIDLVTDPRFNSLVTEFLSVRR